VNGVRRAQRGQIGLAVGLAIAAVFGMAVTGLQMAGLGLTSLEVQHVAQVAADTTQTTPTALTPGSRPCWSAPGGFENPAAFRGTPVCRAIIENAGTIQLTNASVDITRDRDHVKVTIAYRVPLTSPLLHFLFGDTFTTTQDAWSR
jgi:hypothetical protein